MSTAVRLASLAVLPLLAMTLNTPIAAAQAAAPATTAGPAGAKLALPATPTRLVKDSLHGVDLSDPYRWLEGDNSDPANMGKANDEVSSWTDAQNAYTRARLDNLPGRAALEAKFRPLMEIGSVSSPSMRGDFYFYSKREGTENQARIFVRKGFDGTPRVLLDPAQIDPTGLTTISGLMPSQDGTMLVFGMYRAGDENTTLYVMDVNTGRWLPTEISGKAAPIEWLSDKSGFFYSRLANVNDPYSRQIRLHRLGTNPVGDPLLFRQYTKAEDAKLATTWGPGASVSKDNRWLILTYWTSTRSNDIWVVDLREWFKTGNFNRREIKVGATSTFFGDVVGDTFFMITDHEAPNKRIVAVDLHNPAEANWKVIVPEDKNAVLQNFGIAKGLIAADYEQKATSRIRLFALDGTPKGDVKLPGLGSAGISVEDDRTEAFLSFTSFNYPTTIFRTDLAKPDAEPVVWERPAVPVDPSIVEVKQITFPSKDKTPVTMFIVHKKGLALDGNNPTILNGYGGFNISITPSFSATMFPFLEAGGVLAMPNLRGGGEYGKAWHEGGILASKQNTFDDMIAAAEWLIANKYTTPARLGAVGGSNGGLLMGALITQRPDLFSAVVCAVPLLDMLRYQQFLMARYWVPEYGDPANPEHFKWLRAYSPYHNIKPGTKFPAVLFTAGENDTRVHPMHARKMAAAVQAATASDPVAKPVLLWVDREAGHGAGKPLNLRIRDAVDQRIFFMWQLGMLDTLNAKQGATKTDAGEPIAEQPEHPEHLALQVEGMTCGMCVSKVTRLLAKVPGVENVKVDLASKRASIALAKTARTSPDALIKALDGSDFTASVVK
jgi:prolyl oligopeptidase